MRRPSLGAVFLTVVLDLLGFGLVLPFLAAEARSAFHAPEFVGTLLGSTYSLMQFLFVPVWGRLSDRVGRRPVFVWSVAASAISMGALGMALAWGNSVIWLFLARAFTGAATANLGTASAYIADVTKPEDRAKGMGLIGMAFGIGFLFGPPVGSILADVSINGRQGPLACFVAAGLSVVNFVWVVVGLPESLPPEKRNPQASRSLSPLNTDAARAALALPGVGFAVLVNFILIVAFTNLEQTFRFFHEDMFRMTNKETAAVFVVIGLTAAFVQGGLIRPLSKRYAETSLIRSGVALQAVAFGMFAVSPSVGKGLLYGASVVLALGNGLTASTISAYVSRLTDARNQGSTLGTNQSFAALARVFGPAMGGMLYGNLGPRSPYVTAMCGMLLALALTANLRPVPKVAAT
jgi:DHA1 family tetracycline resistance protein-like MFS transporter